MYYNDPSQQHIQLSWVWTEDRQWARSALRKVWGKNQQLTRYVEVRSENLGAGSVRLGDLVITGAPGGTLLCSLMEERVA